MAQDVTSQIDQTGITGGDNTIDRTDISTAIDDIITVLNNILNGAQDAEVLQFAELGADPSTPATSKWHLYTKAGGIFLQDDAGTVYGPLGTGGAGGAPTDATYITQTASSGLSAEQALSALATGLLKNTNGTGVLSIATASDVPDLPATKITSGTLPLARGGTGASAFGSSGPALIYQASTGGIFSALKCNWSATTAPTVSNDGSEGYGVGALWYDQIADKAYTCLGGSLGAAVWKEITVADTGSAGASDSYTGDEVSDITTTSTSFVDVSANFVLSLTTSGGDILLGFSGNVKNTSAGSPTIYFDVEHDDGGTPVRLGGDDGIQFGIVTSAGEGADQYAPIGFTRLITGLSAGTHVLSLQWKIVGTGGGTLICGQGANVSMRPQFWAKELT